jgi:hypothetical protein
MNGNDSAWNYASFFPETEEQAERRKVVEGKLAEMTTKVQELQTKAERERMLRAAIVAACTNGPVEWGKVQRAVNIVAETFFGDLTRCGTTIPAYPLAMQLVGECKLRMSVYSEDGPATYEAIEP